MTIGASTTNACSGKGFRGEHLFGAHQIGGYTLGGMPASLVLGMLSTFVVDWFPLNKST